MLLRLSERSAHIQEKKRAVFLHRLLRMYVWICIRRMHKHRLGVREPNEEEMGAAEPDNQKPLPVAMRLRETPVPIPNTKVKT